VHWCRRGAHLSALLSIPDQAPDWLVVMVFFTSDHHWGHANIIRYCDRPFLSATEMDAEMIRRWNAKVAPSDAVYHLGDFGFHKQSSQAKCIIEQLNGVIFLVPGSHDSKMAGWAALQLFEPKLVLMPPLLMIQPKLSNGTTHPIVLCHYAMRHWERSFHGSWQLHGHTHGRLKPHGLQFDVGVDTNGFAPVGLLEIERIMAALAVPGAQTYDESRI
jgi:calcineurin-like phosphoesterase family protein